jgi:predicted nucleic acid-binding protein
VIVVSNSTPLITLAKVGYFDLLQKLFTEITISQEVWNEVVVEVLVSLVRVRLRKLAG